MLKMVEFLSNQPEIAIPDIPIIATCINFYVEPSLIIFQPLTADFHLRGNLKISNVLLSLTTFACIINFGKWEEEIFLASTQSRIVAVGDLRPDPLGVFEAKSRESVGDPTSMYARVSA